MYVSHLFLFETGEIYSYCVGYVTSGYSNNYPETF